MRAPLSLLVLLVLIFNQVAASVHVIEHVTPGVVATAHDSHLHSGPAHVHDGSRQHVSLLSKQDTHADNTLTCFFYHVLLAAAGNLANAPELSIPSEVSSSILLSYNHPEIAWTPDRVSIRGPPHHS